MNLSVLLVGCGNMGRAMLGGWLKKGINPANVRVINRRLDALSEFQQQKVLCYKTAGELDATFKPNAVVLAVKPQIVGDVAADYQKYVGSGTTFISVAAGKSLSSLEQVLGERASIIRAMPNTPAAIGRGMTVSVANKNVNEHQIVAADVLLGAIGTTAWIKDEAQMDAVTGLSGSGPAYVFYMIEAMKKAGVAAGLSDELSHQLALNTVAGAGELALTADIPVEQLRKNVTSPNGTTAAGLEVLMSENCGLESLMTKTVEAAANRSKEL